LKIGIVGMGVAGSYLAARLHNSHEVVGYERLSEEKFDAVCAWGTSKAGIARFAKTCGLNFENYVLHDGRLMSVDVGKRIVNIGLRGLCSFDKVRFIKDLAKGQTIRFGHFAYADSLTKDNDLLIDSTGVIRPLLPRIKKDCLVPCLQYKVRYKEPPYDDFYIKPMLPELSGYLWYFPLGNGYAHVGAGDLYKRHSEELMKFLRRYPCEIIKKTGRPVRIMPPRYCEPIVSEKVVGVGESIGTVYPILGEGIIPSLQCADLLIENLNDLSTYRKKVLEKFRVYDWVFHFIMSRIKHGFNFHEQILDILRIFIHMKRNENRYGLQVKLADVYNVMRP
jgi:flavin-dependent dehydrogenase